jgi:hypothetical protein
MTPTDPVIIPVLLVLGLLILCATALAEAFVERDPELARRLENLVAKVLRL